MKKLLLGFILTLILIASLCALPLTSLIFQQSAELADKAAAWNKQCGDKPSYDENCMKKRYDLSGELGKFVVLLNDELSGSVSPDAPDDFVKEYNGRRKIMEHEVRVALYNLKCLARSGSDPQWSAESAAIDAQKAALQAEHKQTPHPHSRIKHILQTT